jgi:septum formation protein
MKLCLGSSSIFRKSILETYGFDFFTCSPNIDEKDLGKTFRDEQDATNLVLHLAHLKADALQDKVGECYLVCSDQVIVHNGKIREKPESIQQCREYLQSYQYAPAESYTAVVVVNTKTQKRLGQVDVAKQYFRPIPETVIELALQQGHVMKSSGGFMIENELFKPFLGELVGDETSIMGLPIPVMNNLISLVQ